MIKTDFTALVREFHIKIGAYVADMPEVPPSNIQLLRQRLILEEWGETVVAMHEQNLDQTADGLCDLLYVVVGTGISFGCPVSNRDFAPHEAYRIDPPTHQIVGNVQMVTFWIARTLEHMFNMVQFNSRLAALAIGVYETGCNTYGLPMEELFVEVHRSNMTKDGMNRFDKGGKGDGWQPPQIRKVIERAWTRL